MTAAPAGKVAVTKLKQALEWAAGELGSVVASPRVEAELLLRHLLDRSRSALYLDMDRELAEPALDRFRELVGRRRAAEPLQYLTGSQAFRRLNLAVGPGVLVPRPETEVVVGRACELIDSIGGHRLVDLGTGSGAIALSLGAERPACRVWGTEISQEALGWARLNLQRSGLGNVELLQGDLFSPLPQAIKGRVDLVVSNPPYLSEQDFTLLPPDVSGHEPKLALVAGESGLEVASRIIDGAMLWLRPGGRLVMETNPDHCEGLRSLMTDRLEHVNIEPDLAGLPRIAEGRRP
jgi:release factor glutamine methyltransferase